jgi:hypothetical protein
MPKLRVESFSISVDGFGAGPHPDAEHPLGVRVVRLHNWIFPTRTFQRMAGKDGETNGHG